MAPHPRPLFSQEQTLLRPLVIIEFRKVIRPQLRINLSNGAKLADVAIRQFANLAVSVSQRLFAMNRSSVDTP
jgi:hypothetical protein